MARRESPRMRSAGAGGESSLNAVMRAPSTATPDVVVLDFIREEVKPKDLIDPRKDLWLSTVDGRYSSAIVPVRVGPDAETFSIHREILCKSEYFRRALDGEFKEAGDQVIDLPEENPDIFSFVVAYLYEDRFLPMTTMSTILVTGVDNGKGREENNDTNSDSDEATDSGSASDESTRSRRRLESRRRRAFEQSFRKEPGRHRLGCGCHVCTAETIGPPCWSCGATRHPPPPRPRPYLGPPGPAIMGRNGHPRPQQQRPRDRDRRRAARPPGDPSHLLRTPHLKTECLRKTSEPGHLHIVLASMLRVRGALFNARLQGSHPSLRHQQVAGVEAAIPAVLQFCQILQAGVSSMDPLLRKVFARVGFLQARLWGHFPEETQIFFAENPDLAILIMKEMVQRREEDKHDSLPPMDRPVAPPSFGPDDVFIQGPRRRRDARYYH